MTQTPCIEWTQYCQPNGYGRVKATRFGKRIIYAHVLAWVDANGRLPGEGMHICHHCDNPPCIEPTHLFEGTAGDNMRDRQAKGRGRNQHMLQPNCPKCGGPYSTFKGKTTRRYCKPCQRERLGLSRELTRQVGRSAAECHPDRPMRANGLCHSCYQMEWDATHAKAPATCHPDRPVKAKGLCRACYNLACYHATKGQTTA